MGSDEKVICHEVYEPGQVLVVKNVVILNAAGKKNGLPSPDKGCRIVAMQDKYEYWNISANPLDENWNHNEKSGEQRTHRFLFSFLGAHFNKSQRLASADLTFDKAESNTIGQTNRLKADREAATSSILQIPLPAFAEDRGKAPNSLKVCVEKTGVPYQRVFKYSVYCECAGLPFLHAKRQLPGDDTFPKVRVC